MTISVLLHTVQPGESVERIAHANRLSVAELLSLNPSIATDGEKEPDPSKPRKADGSLIYPGDVLSIPFSHPQPFPKTVITTHYQDLVQTLMVKPLAWKASDTVQFKIPLVGSEYDSLSILSNLYRTVDSEEGANPTSFANITGTVVDIHRIQNGRVAIVIKPDLPINFESFSNHLHEPTHTAIAYSEVDATLSLQIPESSLGDVLEKLN